MTHEALQRVFEQVAAIQRFLHAGSGERKQKEKVSMERAVSGLRTAPAEGRQG